MVSEAKSTDAQLMSEAKTDTDNVSNSDFFITEYVEFQSNHLAMVIDNDDTFLTLFVYSSASVVKLRKADKAEMLQVVRTV